MPDRLDRVAHRGPDGRGWFEWESKSGLVALGHRRLAIIDLEERAHQPMAGGNGRYRLIFNGEIYNYLELRAELDGAGFTFQTQSDSEVLMAALQHWGQGALVRLRGMFAFIWLDLINQTLFVARDPYGIKPLYWAQTPDGLAFASEIKQIYDLHGVSKEPNIARCWDYLMSEVTDHTEDTLFAGVSQIRGGHCAWLDLSAGQPAVVPVRWHKIARPDPLVQSMSFDHSVAKFRDLFDRSIALHQRADVAVGSCLSGGLDSSSIVLALGIGRGPENPVWTYSALFPGTEIDETVFANSAATAAHACQRPVKFSDADIAADLDDAIWHQDEPFPTTSILGQWHVFKAIQADGIKVVVDGQGADELLAGYHGIFDFHEAALAKSGRLLQLGRFWLDRKKKFNIPISRSFSILMVRIMRRVGFSGFEDAKNKEPLKVTLKDLVSERLARARPNSGSTLLDALARDNLNDLKDIGDLCVALTTATSLPMLLRFEDRNSMAHSVEARVPFLDVDLADFCLSLGDRHKIIGATTKSILRTAMRDLLPENIANRTDKLGFATPQAAWLDGPLSEAMDRGLLLCHRRLSGLFAQNYREILATARNSSKKVEQSILWRIASLGLWAERFDMQLDMPAETALDATER